MAAVANGVKIRIIAQAVTSATLLVDNVSKTVSIPFYTSLPVDVSLGENDYSDVNTDVLLLSHPPVLEGCGVVFFISFLGQDVDKNDVDNSVHTLVNSKVFTSIGTPLPLSSSSPLLHVSQCCSDTNTGVRGSGAEERGHEEKDVDDIMVSPKQSEAPLPRPRPVSILECEADVMIIPQATLAGKLKGKSVQYHHQCNKATSEDLYLYFCDKLRKAIINGKSLGSASSLSTADEIQVDANGVPCIPMSLTPKGLNVTQQHLPISGNNYSSISTKAPNMTRIIRKRHRVVLNGTYGNRQALHMDSPGPYTHLFEF